MARRVTTTDSLSALFDESSRPIYAVDAERRIVYCNRALATWLGVETKRIIDRLVEFHSEPAAEDEDRNAAPLADLCPPPMALAGEPCTATVSCMDRGGRLVHRQAEFVPLGCADAPKTGRKSSAQATERFAVLVLLAASDMSAQDVSSGLSGEPTSDELHRTIRRFRRAQVGRYSIESLLGGSQVMQRIRAQMAAAVASGANTLICGPRGSGRGHAARAIHYCGVNDAGERLVPIDCELLTDYLFQRVVDVTRSFGSEQRATLLLENIDRMSSAHQSLLEMIVREKALDARIIATCCSRAALIAEGDESEKTDEEPDQDGEVTASKDVGIDPALLSLISTITIQIPRLSDRTGDLPVIAQYFLEACNQGSSKQIGAFRSDALDLLALYSWPGELDQLRKAIEAAHRACTSHAISANDLPRIVHHALSAATRTRREPERINLDDLLASIEKEAIIRALDQSGGNKSEAAELLGMTRPRLYRRLVQLGMVEGEDQEAPEFIEHDPTE